jgi:hypothetical protein
MVSTKQVQQIKCGIGLDTIIISYKTMPSRKRKSDLFLEYPYNEEKF